MKKHQQSLTSLPQSPDRERRSRMVKYSIAMSIRLLCLLSLIFVRDWWLVVFGVAAAVLPWFAVVIANTVTRSGVRAETPGGVIIPLTPDTLGMTPREVGGRPE